MIIIKMPSFIGINNFGGAFMDKEEILRRSRAENCDEMEMQTRDKSMKWTYITLVLSAAIFAFIRDMNNQPSMDLCATVALSVFAGRIYCFARTKNRYDIIIAVITCAIAVFATIRFFMGH